MAVLVAPTDIVVQAPLPVVLETIMELEEVREAINQVTELPQEAVGTVNQDLVQEVAVTVLLHLREVLEAMEEVLVGREVLAEVLVAV